MRIVKTNGNFTLLEVDSRELSVLMDLKVMLSNALSVSVAEAVDKIKLVKEKNRKAAIETMKEKSLLDPFYHISGKYKLLVTDLSKEMHRGLLLSDLNLMHNKDE